MITSQISDFNLDFAGLNNRRALVFYENYINNIYFSVYCFSVCKCRWNTWCFHIKPGNPGKVIRVLDGDTIEVLQDKQDKKPVRIRLANIDAPEKNRLSGAGQQISLKLCLQHSLLL